MAWICKLRNLQAYNFANKALNQNCSVRVVNMLVLSTVSNFQRSIFNTQRE